MRRVRHEPPQLRLGALARQQRPLDAPQHLVERRRQPRHLVVLRQRPGLHPGHRDRAALQLQPAHLVGRVRQRDERLGGAHQHRPRHRGRGRDGHEAHRGRQQRQPQHRPLDVRHGSPTTTVPIGVSRAWTRYSPSPGTRTVCLSSSTGTASSALPRLHRHRRAGGSVADDPAEGRAVGELRRDHGAHPHAGGLQAGWAVVASVAAALTHLRRVEFRVELVVQDGAQRQHRGERHEDGHHRDRQHQPRLQLPRQRPPALLPRHAPAGRST